MVAARNLLVIFLLWKAANPDCPINAFIFGLETGSHTLLGFASTDMIFSAYLLVFWAIFQSRRPVSPSHSIIG